MTRQEGLRLARYVTPPPPFSFTFRRFSFLSKYTVESYGVHLHPQTLCCVTQLPVAMAAENKAVLTPKERQTLADLLGPDWALDVYFRYPPENSKHSIHFPKSHTGPSLRLHHPI